MRTSALILISILVLLFSESAYAYIGPGIGTGTIGVILGFIASIFLALFAVVWYPLKRMFKKKNKKSKESKEDMK